MQIYRVVVRGQFNNLDDDTSAILKEKAPEHDFLLSAFTDDGTFTYDGRLVVFNLRYEIRVADDVDDPAGEVEVEALSRAKDWLQAAGYPYKRLKTEVTNMASVWE